MIALLIIPLLGIIVLYFKPTKRFALGISILILMEVIRIQFGMIVESGEYQNVVRFG